MKEHLFTLHGWYCWFVHSLILGGLLMFGILGYMQWVGPDELGITINLPSVMRHK